jgi:Ca2+:H+ antiporter
MNLKTFYSRWWPVIFPVVSGIFLLLHLFISGSFILIILAAGLLASVFSAVHHAEVISHKVGDPYGTLILALAVTIIEVSLIVSLMLAHGAKESALARDTIFSEIMIILNGMIGVSLLIGGLKFREQVFHLQGVSSTLIILVGMSVLTLILPNYTQTIPGPVYSNSQLIFVAIVTLVLYASFIIFQNVKHRAYFLSIDEVKEVIEEPTTLATTGSGIFLIVSLAIVVLIAETLSPSLEHAIYSVGAPKSIMGAIIACIVLMPEAFSAIRAATTNNLQKSLNFSLGSALASIGLTIPAVAMVSIITGSPLSLGIDIKSTVLYALTILVITLSLSTGKTTGVEGIVLLVILAVYFFTIIVP